MRGTIKNLNLDRGFGFIVGEDQADRFFHRSALRPGLRLDELRQGDAVEFDHEEGQGGKGPRATDVGRA
jgi:cold shock CspA family protein